MLFDNSRISIRQMRRMLMIEIFSTTSLLLPALVTRQAGHNGLLPLIGGSILGMIYVQILLYFINQSGQDFIGYVRKSVGKIGLIIITVLYGFRFVVRCGFVLQLFATLIIEAILPEYPFWAISAPILILCGYLALNGLEVRARTLELLFFLIFVPLILVLLLAMPQVDFTQSIPRMPIDIISTMKGSYGVLLSLSAVEFILFSVPNLHVMKRIRKNVTVACLFPILLNIVIFVVTVGMFGAIATKRSLWPALSIMKTVKLPGGFVERLDILLIAFWIFSMFGIISAYLFYAVNLGKQIMGNKKWQWLIPGFLILVYIWAANAGELEQSFVSFFQYMAYADFPLALLTPAVVLIIGRIRRVG